MTTMYLFMGLNSTHSKSSSHTAKWYHQIVLYSIALKGVNLVFQNIGVAKRSFALQWLPLQRVANLCVSFSDCTHNFAKSVSASLLDYDMTDLKNRPDIVFRKHVLSLSTACRPSIFAMGKICIRGSIANSGYLSFIGSEL